jgi:hypothetical protein
MVADFGRLADTLLNGTRDKLIEKDIRENAVNIAQQIERQGFYENADLGFKVSIDSGNNHNE